MAQRRYTLPRSRRLSGRQAFRRVFDGGVRAARGAITIYVLPNALGHPRLGLTVRRQSGTAAQRNRIKRLLREAFRHLQHDLPAAYDVVVAVRRHEPLALAEYQKIMSALLIRAHGHSASRR